MNVDYFSNIPNNRYDLCSKCKHAEIYSYENDNPVYNCMKWQAIVERVGVCRYYEEKKGGT